MLICPGYALLSALFPARDTLSKIERIAYSLALSIALIALLGLLLNYVWEISLYPIIILSESVIFLSIGVAWFRRRSLPDSRRLNFYFKWQSLWKEKKPLDKIFIVLAVIVIVGTIGASVFAYYKNIPGITEFYILNTNGKAEKYPQNLLVGEKGDLTLTIANKEHQTMTYRLSINYENGTVWINDKVTNDFLITLNDGQKWTGDIGFIFNEPGPAQKIEFTLFKDQETQPYLTTFIKIDVSS